MPKKIEVVILGLGYIGLPTAALISNTNKFVFGVDTNQNVVDTINKGQVHIIEPELDIAVEKAVKGGFFKASTKAVAANTYLLAVPTPFKTDNQPDISFVKAATASVLNLLKAGDFLLLSLLHQLELQKK
jgi:UDP-N-acetyl-D-mannosaminuronic acid dehydrogenase